MERPVMLQNIAFVLWPSFLVACVMEMVFFTLFDPVEMHLLGNPVAMDRQAVYSIGFFCFWSVTAASSALTLFLTTTGRPGPGAR
jgi:hypothetical protein